MNNKVTSKDIIQALERRYTDDKYIFESEVKNGSTWMSKKLYRFDAVAIKKTWSRPDVHIFEVKVSKSDFRRDKKWQNYLEYCNLFSFACPHGLIGKGDLPDGIGLIWYKPDTGCIRTIRRPKYVVRSLRPQMLLYLLMYRSGRPRTKLGVYVKSWLAAKMEDRRVGRNIAALVSKRVQDLEARNVTLRKNRVDLNILVDCIDQLHRAGLSPYTPEDALRDGGWNFNRAIEVHVKKMGADQDGDGDIVT